MVLPITPVPKPRMTRRDKWANRPSVVRYFEFCDRLRELWGVEPVGDTIYLRFNMPMPASWSAKKRKLMDGKPHQQRPDIDNLAKAFLDALCKDDSYVYAIQAEKYWSEHPSIRVDEYPKI